MNSHEITGRPNPDRNDSGWVGAPADDDLDQCLEADDKPYDKRLSHVMTALGPIPPAALGVTLFGSWDQPLLAPGREPGMVLIELERLYTTGVRAVVDLAAASDSQRADLAWVSQRSPVHIVVGASPPEVTAPANDHLPIGISRIEALGAPGEAVVRPDRPPFVHAETWSAATRYAASSTDDEHGWTGWTIVAEPASATPGVVQAALAAGARLVFIVGDARADVMADTAGFIRDLVELGFGERVSLGYNADPILVMERFPLLLMDAGLPAIAVRRILVDNPAEALTIQIASREDPGEVMA